MSARLFVESANCVICGRRDAAPTVGSRGLIRIVRDAEDGVPYIIVPFAGNNNAPQYVERNFVFADIRESRLTACTK